MQQSDSFSRRHFLGTTGILATCAASQFLQQPLGAQEPLDHLSGAAIASSVQISSLKERLNPKITALRQAALQILKPTSTE
ncbi:MAG: hypothetical protein ACPHJ3_06200, partial [Rubripirellula sp.]